jgi:hypothetical protein
VRRRRTVGQVFNRFRRWSVVSRRWSVGNYDDGAPLSSEGRRRASTCGAKCNVRTSTQSDEHLGRNSREFFEALKLTHEHLRSGEVSAYGRSGGIARLYVRIYVDAGEFRQVSA